MPMCSFDVTDFEGLSAEPKGNLINLADPSKHRLGAMTNMLDKIESNKKEIEERISGNFNNVTAHMNETERYLLRKSLVEAQDHFKELTLLTNKIAEGGEDAVDEKEIHSVLNLLKEEKNNIDNLIGKTVSGTATNTSTNDVSSSSSSKHGVGNLMQQLLGIGLKMEESRLNSMGNAKSSASSSSNMNRSNVMLHGKRFQTGWEEPQTVAACKDLARPKYDSRTTAEEKLDTKETLDKKLDLVAQIMMGNKSKKSTVVYSGAGLSTAAGIGDYASKAKGSVAPHMKGNVAPKGNRLDLRPTLGHHALAAMADDGLVHHWVQQNHDRLAQKAGYPQEKICEIHGAWGDHKNPVVAMSGSLRRDLYEWWEDWCDRADVCLVVGTSLAGMNADTLPKTVGNNTDNLIIVGLTPTGLDHLAGVRIWGLLDDVLVKLAKKMKISKVPNPETKRRGDMWISSHPGCKYNTPVRDNKAERIREEEARKKKAELAAKRSSGSKFPSINSARNSKTSADANSNISSSKSTSIHRKSELSGSRLF